MLLDVSETIRLEYLVHMFRRYAIGIFELSNGKKAYVASVDPLGKNLIIELKDGSYVILRPNNFKEFIKIFSKEILHSILHPIRSLKYHT